MRCNRGPDRSRPATIALFALISSLLISACGLDILKKSDREESGPIEVLFIGNSLTGEGDTTLQFAMLAEGAGFDSVIVGECIKGGATLEDHIASYTTKAKIAERQWDYVVIQGSSYLVAFPEYHSEVYPGYVTLKEIIHNNWHKTRIVMFMDWSMTEVTMFDSTYTFSQFSQMLHDGYLAMAESLDFIVAPVGWAWKRVVEERPDIELLHDPIHPNVAGAHLQACVYFATIFRRSPEGLPHPGRFESETARYLQKVAGETVLNNKRRWRIP